MSPLPDATADADYATDVADRQMQPTRLLKWPTGQMQPTRQMWPTGRLKRHEAADACGCGRAE